jgi:hypothetical protein
MPTPEELARVNIDKLLTSCGWTIQDMSGLNRYASLGACSPSSAGRTAADRGRRLLVAREVESVVEKALVRAGRLRQAILKSAFEGKLS